MLCECSIYLFIQLSRRLTTSTRRTKSRISDISATTTTHSHWKSNYEHFLVSHAAGSNVRNTKKTKRNTSAENIQISDSIFGWIIESLTDRIIFHMESTKYALDSDHK